MIGRKQAALALLAITQFLVVLDMTVVNVALPSIDRDLGFAPENLSWVINAYVFAFGGFLLLGGRSADPARPAASVHVGPRSVRRRLVDQRPRAE